MHVSITPMNVELRPCFWKELQQVVRKLRQFNTPHNIGLDREGNIYVADRQNARIQVFDTEGEKSNDLFMYKLGKVTIPRNSKLLP